MENSLQLTNTQQQKDVKSVGIKSIEFIDHEDVYNMEVEDNHNFVVNGGIVVHNCMDATRYFVQTMGIYRNINKQNGYKPIILGGRE